MRRVTTVPLACVLLLAASVRADAPPVPATEPAALTFFPRPGDGHEPRQVVYVLDVSEAPGGGASLARREITRAVRELVGAQSFNLVVAGAEEPACFAKAMVPASDKSRDAACEWLQRAGASPRPSSLIRAIRTALELKPDVVRVVVNRNFIDPGAVREIGLLNRQAIRVDVTALVGDPADAGWTDVFREIAIHNGGTCSPVRLADFDPARAKGLGGSMFVLTLDRPEPNRIIFVCDASGSMLNKFRSLRSQLQKAVGALRPTQSFNIIVIREADCQTFAPNPCPASPENKQRAAAFMETKVTPRGETNPIPALEAAFAQKPQLMFLVTDGDFPDNGAVLKRIRELDHHASVPVNTIAFVDESDTDTDFFKLLKQVADETGAHYAVAKENELR